MQVATDLCTRLNKTPVESADYPGFIANRILNAVRDEAIRLFEEALAELVAEYFSLDVAKEAGGNPFTADKLRARYTQQLTGDVTKQLTAIQPSPA